MFNANLKLGEKMFIKDLKPKTYNGLYEIYKVINDQKESMRYLKLTLEAAQAENNLFFIGFAHLKLGDKMEELKDYRLAQYHYRQSINNLKTVDTHNYLIAMNHLACSYYDNNKIDSALQYYTTLISEISSKNFSMLSNNYGHIGNIYRDKKDYKKAIESYRKGIEFGEKGESIFNIHWISLNVSEIYRDIGDYKNAYKYYVLYKTYSDSLNKQNYNSELLDAKAKYFANENEQKLELLSLKLSNQKMFIYGFVGFLMLSGLIGFLLIRQSRLKAKRRISEMNQKISEITQANLRQQMNPHFIFNTLNSIQYYMYQHDKLATNNYLTKFSSLMRRILENSQHTSIPLNDELDALTLYLELESIRFKDRFDYEIKIDDEIDTLMYKVPTMLIQPYVENAICHGLMNKDEKGRLVIEINLNNDYLTCIIEDNGVGREAAMEIRRKKVINHNSLATKIIESRLDLVNLLYGTSLKTIFTDLKDENGEPNGTRVEIQIPVLT